MRTFLQAKLKWYLLKQETKTECEKVFELKNLNVCTILYFQAPGFGSMNQLHIGKKSHESIRCRVLSEIFFNQESKGKPHNKFSLHSKICVQIHFDETWAVRYYPINVTYTLCYNSPLYAPFIFTTFMKMVSVTTSETLGKLKFITFIIGIHIIIESSIFLTFVGVFHGSTMDTLDALIVVNSW